MNKVHKTGWGKSYSEWRVKDGKTEKFRGSKGDCEDFIRKNSGKFRLIPPNKPGK